MQTSAAERSSKPHAAREQARLGVAFPLPEAPARAPEAGKRARLDLVFRPPEGQPRAPAARNETTGRLKARLPAPTRAALFRTARYAPRGTKTPRRAPSAAARAARACAASRPADRPSSTPL